MSVETDRVDRVQPPRLMIAIVNSTPSVTIDIPAFQLPQPAWRPSAMPPANNMASVRIRETSRAAETLSRITKESQPGTWTIR